MTWLWTDALIINNTLRNLFQLKTILKFKSFIRESAIENVVCTMSAILSGPLYVIIAICFVFKIKMNITFQDIILFTAISWYL